MWAIPGLEYVPAYLSPAEQVRLLAIIDGKPWTLRAKQRTQQYGYAYHNASRPLEQLGVLPSWIKQITRRLHRDGYAPVAPDQVTVDECQPGQGLAAQVENADCFGATVLAISLGSPCIIQFASVDSERRAVLLLQPGSLLVLRDEVRYRWTHEIKARWQDEIENLLVRRQRRVSLTLRKVIG